VPLSSDQRCLLDQIARFNGPTNWYQVGRAVLGKLSTPAALDELRWLIDHGFVSEAPSGGNLPTLELTLKGRDALQLSRDD
jgi:hypothetical protein